MTDNGHYSTEEQWAAFRDAVYSTAYEHLGPATRRNQDWFDGNDEEIQALLSEKNISGSEHTRTTPRPKRRKKVVYGPQSSGCSPLLTTNGTQLLTEEKHILEKWAEHFDQVLNRPASINDEAVACEPEVEINQDLDNYPTEEEVRKAIKKLSCVKAPVSDAIPAEVYKAGGPVMLLKLTKLFQFFIRVL